MSGTEEEISLQDAEIGAQAFNVEIARLQLEEAQTPSSSSLWSASVRIQHAQLQLEEMQAGATQTEIDNAERAIDRAQANVEDAQTALLKTQLVTPVTGYVMSVNTSAGDSVTSTLQMTVPVNELYVKKIAVGQSAVIELDALWSTETDGTVDNVGWLSSTSSDGIVTYDVRVVLNTNDSRVRIGMTGEVAQSYSSLRDSIGGPEVLAVLPGGAVFDILDGPVCSGGYNWYQVSYNGVVGWVTEGYAGDYWLEPVDLD